MNVSESENNDNRSNIEHKKLERPVARGKD